MRSIRPAAILLNRRFQPNLRCQRRSHSRKSGRWGNSPADLIQAPHPIPPPSHPLSQQTFGVHVQDALLRRQGIRKEPEVAVAAVPMLVRRRHSRATWPFSEDSAHTTKGHALFQEMIRSYTSPRTYALGLWQGALGRSHLTRSLQNLCTMFSASQVNFAAKLKRLSLREDVDE